MSSSKPRIQILRRERPVEKSSVKIVESEGAKGAAVDREAEREAERERERERRELEYELLRERMGLAAVEEQAAAGAIGGVPSVPLAEPLSFSLYDRRGAIPAQILVTTAAERQAQQAQFEKQQRELLEQQQQQAAAAAAAAAAASAAAASSPAVASLVGPSFSPADFPPLSA